MGTILYKEDIFQGSYSGAVVATGYEISDFKPVVHPTIKTEQEGRNLRRYLYSECVFFVSGESRL